MDVEIMDFFWKLGFWDVEIMDWFVRFFGGMSKLGMSNSDVGGIYSRFF